MRPLLITFLCSTHFIVKAQGDQNRAYTASSFPVFITVIVAIIAIIAIFLLLRKDDDKK